MHDFLRKLAGHFVPSEHNAYRPHLLRRPWLLFLLTVIVASEGIYIGSYLASQSAQNLLSAVVPGEVIALTNAERAKAGDGALTENAELDAAAQAKASDMAAKGYFSHVGPDGKEPWAWISEAGYAYSYAGENLAVRFDNSSDVVSAWMASPTHKANIVKPQYTEIGLAVADGTYQGSPATFIVQYFGTPKTTGTTNASAQAGSSAGGQQGDASKPGFAAAANASTAEVAGASTESVTKTAAPTTTAPQASAPAQAQPQDAAGEQAPLRAEAQSFVRASDASQQASEWILGGIAALIILVLGLTFFVHMQIQPVELLLGGAFVGAVAVSLFMLNNSFAATAGQSSQAAAASLSESPILLGEAASTQLP
ncbi:MAG TPA: CAP domain-containing protein [Candidatus Paceibacterota bacterium]|nr:CAP domain-containing protein [Candidatus Paceibacterota bacterium]